MNPKGYATHKSRLMPTPRVTPAPSNSPLMDAWLAREQAQKAEAMRVRVLDVLLQGGEPVSMTDRIVRIWERAR